MNPTRTVQLRLLGDQADVDTIAHTLADHVNVVTEPSRPYPNRRGTGVRVFLEVRPR